MGRACSTFGERRGVGRVFMRKLEGKRPLGRPMRRCKDNMKIDFQEVGWGPWTGLMRLRMWTGDGLLSTSHTFTFHSYPTPSHFIPISHLHISFLSHTFTFHSYLTPSHFIPISHLHISFLSLTCYTFVHDGKFKTLLRSTSVHNCSSMISTCTVILKNACFAPCKSSNM